MFLFGKELTYRELRSLVGDLSQVGGITPLAYADGKAAGMKLLNVRTGSGLVFNVLPDRCLDVCNLEYNGIPFAHIAKAGITAPWYYDPHGEGWLRSFHAGFMTTCGFTNAGMACDMDGKHYGLHGRASHIPATEVNTHTNVTGDEVELMITGTIREAAMEQENIVLFRTIKAKLGGKKISITDRYTNEGFQPEPLLLIYHLNIGYPIFSTDSRLIADIEHTEPFSGRFPDSAHAMDRFASPGEPAGDAQTQVFFHELRGNEKVSVQMFNERLNTGIKITFDKRVLPYFSQARILKATDYYTVLEPANCYPLGRKDQAEQYGLEVLEPEQIKTVELDVEIQ